ncbi:DUF4233 domain-containing protein [Microbacterium sp. VKM Ac-2923]|uniref:DUF4233 domain-containing protein n=1 Tax=Microbacterium sp. VKM Ac-2923 TaxID=2929476 RepID=UPI001FB4915B|nr:DUF4233 domain-containing protein [Microbacterium sp. VKM Ac-2923]MCJ1707501.1 DUF4233 domain-containing protein [Microbacterium sp. VKM Ac-2923]
MSPRTPRSPRPRRQRGAQESLGAVVLGFESIVVFLGGLVVYGLKVLPFGIPDWWGIVGGVVMAVAMVAVSGLLRHRGAIIAGWALQAILMLGGLLVPALAVVALIFGGMWAYATIKGAALDRQNARRAADPDLSTGE